MHQVAKSNNTSQKSLLWGLSIKFIFTQNRKVGVSIFNILQLRVLQEKKSKHWYYIFCWNPTDTISPSFHTLIRIQNHLLQPSSHHNSFFSLILIVFVQARPSLCYSQLNNKLRIYQKLAACVWHIFLGDLSTAASITDLLPLSLSGACLKFRSSIQWCIEGL